MENRIRLENRYREILYCIIENYIGEGSPVGSRIISKRYNVETLSPASIRNVMADLEEMGLLSQPHVSAGRIPTDEAYRMFVEDLINSENFDFPEREEFQKKIEEQFEDFNNFFSAISKTLSDYTGNIGIALTPVFDEIKCRNIRFVKVEDQKVLAVLVSKHGLVFNKLIQVNEVFKQDQLDRISNFVKENFYDMTIQDMLIKIDQLLQEEKAKYDLLMKTALELSKKSVEDLTSEESGFYYSGTEHLFKRIARVNYEKIIDLYKAFEDKTRLFTLLHQCLKQEGLNVIIGSENIYKDLEDFSLITATYSSQGRVLGSLAVLGPKRMRYDSAIKAVYHGTIIVSNILTKSGF